MEWIEAKIATTSAAVELLTGFLIVHNVNNVRIIDDEEVNRFLLDHPLNWDYKDDKTPNLPGAEIIFHVQADEFGKQILAEIAADLPTLPQTVPQVDFGTLAFTFGNVNDDTWLNEWKKTYKPFQIGRNITVVPVWEHYEKYNPQETVFKIDPGAVFGTGLHETTQLCVQSLERLDLRGKSILDIGCGSGILSIIAMLLGASRATACDIDPSAESCAKTNAELNGVADYNVQIGNIFDEDFLAALTKNGEYDIAVANIVADVIIDLSPLAKKFLKKGGIFVVSGIIDERMPEVLRTLQLDLTVKKFFQNNGWICMVAELDKKAV